MIRSLWAIAWSSLAEITRQPVYGILLLAGMFLIGASPAVCAFTMMEDVKLVIDMGLGTIFMLGLVLAVLSATRIISREIEAKTAGAIISKPVGRVVFVLGKFLGVSLAMALATFLLTVILIMTVRMGVPTTVRWSWDWPVFLAEFVPLVLAMAFALHANYFYRWNFTATAVKLAFPLYIVGFIFTCVVAKNWRIDSGEFFWIGNTFLERNCDQVLLAAVLVFFGVWVISSVAVAASTRLTVVANGRVCLAVFFVGMISHFLFGWTVDYAWVDWVPEEGQETVKVSGHVTGANGGGVAGVRMKGLPGAPATDTEGYYEGTVGKGRSGTVKPRRDGYLFSPRDRAFGSISSDETQQDYAAFEHYKGVARYAYTAWEGTAWAAYHIVPSLQLFWVADQLVRPEPYIPKFYVVRAGAYAVLWCGAMVALAAFLFESRDII